MHAIVVRVLTSVALQRFARVLFIALAEHYARRTDNRVDDDLVAAIKEALG